MTYGDFFRRATGFNPFPYQKRIVADGSLPSMLEAPTGAGKTAAVILAWLWLRRFGSTDQQSRRLVYALPMRVLVDQVANEVQRWLDNLELDEAPLVQVLRGGQVEETWEEQPDKEAVLIGTQDQLLSRALNRGYAMSPYRWPMHFGLLHNDAHWVLDEVQLMGPGLRTASQLEGLRKTLGSFGPTGTTFMSATLRSQWIVTPDLPAASLEASLSLDEADRNSPVLRTRLEAHKPIRVHRGKSDAKTVASLVVEKHMPGTVTLVVVNQVARAQELAKAVRKKGLEPLVIHSRFRPADRRDAEALLKSDTPEEGRVVIATQTIEAGVDLSARLLITELAPWPSLVQRFGRCNRKGEIGDAEVIWIDLDTTKEKECAPYIVEALDVAREILSGLDDARIASLPAISADWPTTDIPRRRDVIELFDTDPDLDGNHVDVSRYVRGDGLSDVSLYWRTFDERPGPDVTQPSALELCSVSLPAIADFMKKATLFAWDSLEGVWVRAHRNASGAAPGFVSAGRSYLVECGAGGYRTDTGFDGKSKSPVAAMIASGTVIGPSMSSDPQSRHEDFVALDVHLADVACEAKKLTTVLNLLSEEQSASVEEAAGWHDIGKGHFVFQDAIPAPRPAGLLAKGPVFNRYVRAGFRHELVSALVAVEGGRSDLVAYLALAHHGKVRTAIRPLRWDTEPGVAPLLRGVKEGDRVPSVSVPDGEAPAVEMSLGLSRLGGGGERSWAVRVSRLLDQLGPFRLAYLETLVRVADWRASASPSAILEVPDA